MQSPEKTLEIVSRLVAVEESTVRLESDLGGKAGSESLLHRLVSHSLAIVTDSAAGDHAAIAWVLGPVAGEFVPIVSHKDAAIHPLRIRSEDMHDLGLPQSHAPLTDAQRLLLFGARTNLRKGTLIAISSRGELVGFAAFCPVGNGDVIDPAPEVRALLQRVVGDAVFTFRLQLLSSRLEVGDDTDLQVYASNVANLVSLGMGADGAVLRFSTSDAQNLAIAGKTGQLSDRADEHESFRRAICQRVADAQSSPFLAVTLRSRDGDPEILGVDLTPEEVAMLWDIGIRALLLHRVESKVVKGEADARVGVLGVYFRRKRQFSIRDVALFRSSCERVGDEAALIMKGSELRRQRDDLAFNVLLLEASSSVSSRAETIALLAHTLYHRVRSVKELGDMVKTASVKAHSREGSYSAVTDRVREMLAVVEELFRQIYQISALGRRSEEPDRKFKLVDLVNDVQELFRAVLVNNDMEMSYQGDRNIELFGNSEVLRQVILNLTLNSIEAQKETDRARHNAITIRVRKEEGGMHSVAVIIFGDEGPGINRRVFPKPDEIFILGKTSKKTGTGTGLAISRSLLYQMFGGELRLVSASPAVFELRVPLLAPN